MKHLKLFFALFAMLALGVGNAWGAEGDVLKTYDTNSSTFASGYSRKTGDNFVWWGQKGFYGANSAANHGNLKPTAADLPVVKAQNSSATTSTTGYYYLYTSEAVANVGKVEVKFTAKSGSSTVNAYVVSSSTEAASGSATWTKVTLAPESPKVQGVNVASAGTYTFTFDATETTAKYYGVVFVTSSYWRATGLTFKLYEGEASTPKTPYTVTFHTTATNEQEKVEGSAGSGVTPPEMEAECGEWSFQGWSESFSNSETSTTVLSTITLENGKYYPTADVNLYPVYTKTSTGGGTEYVLSDIGAISSGDIFVFADESNYALTNNNGTASAVGVKSITVSNDKITSTVDATIEWQLTGNNTSGYTFYPGTGTTSWLYCNTTANSSSNNNMRVGTGGRKLFVVNNNGYLVTNDTYTDRYLSRYNTQDFRGYTSTNTNPVKPKLYKKTTGSTTYYYSYPECSGEPEPVIVKTLKSIAVSGMTIEYVEDAEFTFDGICTATYSVTKNDVAQADETVEVTPTSVSTPDMATAGEKEITVTYTENEVTKTATYNITVNAKPKYTITWNNAGSTTETKVVQGAPLGELLTVADCPSGKKFMGWTAATEVNNDGSGIVYVKETDIPTSDMTYYAVFAVVTSTGEPVTSYKKVTTISDGTYLIAATNSLNSYAYTGQVSGKKFGGYIAVTIANDEITAKPAEAAEITVKVTDGKFSMHDGSKYLYLSSSDNELHYNDAEQIVWALDAEGKINITTYSSRYLRFNAQSGNERFACYSSAQKDAFLYKKVTTTSETVSDYSLDCSITVEPTWTISKDAIDFADKYVGVSYTETFTISASNLTDDIALAIDGSNFTVSPTSIATDAEFPQTVTVTYAPTAAGSHNATLNITSGSTLSKAIALTGSAEEATIYTLTALADIKPTDKVIIVGTNASGNYAMSNDKGTSDAPDAVEVAVADNKIATNETNILWNIAKNGDNLTIYPADQTAKWLYCLADENDGVRVGTGNAKEFTIDKGYLYATQTTTPRHIGIYNNSDWRCYKPSADAIHTNIKDQSFAFYVLPNTDPSISVTPASKDFDVLTVGETATQEFEITALNITQALNAELTGEGFTKSEIVDNKITITFAPTEVKEYSATLTISAGTEASVSVTLEGEGVAATYSVTYDKNGAEGDAPTDDTKYVADSKVTVAGQGDMTKAGYRFAGWKYSENIYKEGAKFNMPAEDVTFVAQWVEKQKFDAGYWVLVTDASELNADDYVVIAAADYDVAMKSYETGNNCKQVEVTKVNNLLTWNENVGVFQLDKSGENYTFQDVNTEQYLYAAGGTSNNYLRAADAIPTDENAKKYTWTISVADNKATIKAQIEDDGDKKAHNWLRYNNTESGKLFSCYDATSKQKDIALYKYQTTYAYTRTVTNGNYGTICLPYGSSSYTGMELYEVSWLKEGTGLYLDQLTAGAQLEAGKPYIFKATDSKITVTYTGDAVADPVAGENGLTGTFTDIAAGGVQGHYIIAQNKIWEANDQNTLPANRAYIDKNGVPTTEQAKLPGRRRVCMGENAATGLDNITNGENTTIKVIENGQLIIIRGGEKFNAQGQRL